MPMSPRPQGTAVSDTTGHGVPPPPGGTVLPYGLVELTNQGGTLLGYIQRTAEGLLVKQATLEGRKFKGTVFVPWTSVLYWVYDNETL